MRTQIGKCVWITQPGYNARRRVHAHSPKRVLRIAFPPLIVDFLGNVSAGCGTENVYAYSLNRPDFRLSLFLSGRNANARQAGEFASFLYLSIGHSARFHVHTIRCSKEEGARELKCLKATSDGTEKCRQMTER